MMISQTLAMLLGIFSVALASTPGAETCSGEMCAALEAADAQDASDAGLNLLQAAMRPHKAEATEKKLTRQKRAPLKEKVRTAAGEKAAMSFPRFRNQLAAARLEGRFRNRKHGFWSMFMSTTGHAARLKSTSKLGSKWNFGSKSKSNLGSKLKFGFKSTSKLGSKLKFGSKSKSNLGSKFKFGFKSKSKQDHEGGQGQSPEVSDICPVCGDQNDPASCFATGGPFCSEDLNDPACIAWAEGSNCMACLDCVRPLMAGPPPVQDSVSDICPTCGDENDPASCFATGGPFCSEDLNDPACIAWAEESNCMACLDCVRPLMAGPPPVQDSVSDICPACGDEADPTGCIALGGPFCSEDLNDPACVAWAEEANCVACVDCIADEMESQGKGNGKGKGDHQPPPVTAICPACGEPNDPASCLALCGPSCSETDINDPVCLASFVGNDCMACHDCIVPLLAGPPQVSDICPACGDQNDPNSCFASCVPSCSGGPDDPACIAAFTAKNCMPCYDCLVEHDG